MTSVAGETTRMCRSCGEEYPATSQFFTPKKSCLLGLGWHCKPCRAEQERVRRVECADKIAAYKRRPEVAARRRELAARPEKKQRDAEWQRNNREKCREYGRRYYANHPEKSREYYESHKKEHAQWMREWSDARPEYGREAQRRWRASHPDRVQENNRNSDARRRGAKGSFTRADVTAMYVRQEGRCLYCNKLVGDDFHADHYIPIARGGTNLPLNIVIACPTCNLSKGSKLPSEFLTHSNVTNELVGASASAPHPLYKEVFYG